MGLADVGKDDVLAAIAECDDLGHEEFRAKYRFGRSRRYLLVHAGREYDSKAILGVAHQHATDEPLRVDEFNGGEQTIARLSKLGFDVRDVQRGIRPDDIATFGEVDGVRIGQVFASRREVSDARVHRNVQAGIVGKAKVGAESIVVSGGYEDDEDHGSFIIYTGHGGQDSKGNQVFDQTFESSGNAALKTSSLNGMPVRVVRGANAKSPHAPTTGYRYDGLFRVESAWREAGQRGFQVCRYRLTQLDTTYVSSDLELPAPAEITSRPDGNHAPARRTGTTQRLVRSTAVAEYVKNLHDHTCQTCQVRLTVSGRGYSEGAHIQAIGRPHDGPDIPANVLCLCPNCHVLFDGGALMIDDDLVVRINGEPSGQLITHPSHAVDQSRLTYHREIHE